MTERRSRGARRPRSRPTIAGFSLAEVLVALSLVASVGVIATGAGRSLARLARAARSEAAGLAAARARIEELLAAPPAQREGGNDEMVVDGLRIARVWRVRPDAPAPGLSWIEVTARWEHPSITLLTLVAVAS